MDRQYHAEFLQRIGHDVTEHNGVLWFDVFSRAYTTIPYDAPIDCASFDPSSVLGKDGLMLRHSCPVDQGVVSFQHVVTDKNYGMSTLISRARNKTRQGLRLCTAGQIDPIELGEAGIRLHAETIIRQGRKLPHDFEAYWKKYFEEASKSPCVLRVGQRGMKANWRRTCFRFVLDRRNMFRLFDQARRSSSTNPITQCCLRFWKR